MDEIEREGELEGKLCLRENFKKYSCPHGAVPFRAYRVNFRINESARFICGEAVVQSAPAHLTVSVRSSVRPSNGTTGANVTHFTITIRPLGRAGVD